MASDQADKDAIRELLATYCFHLDGEQFEEMAALFTEDGVWDTAFGTGTGRAGIVAQARSIAAGGGRRPRRAHLTTNIVIELSGETAHVRSNWAVVQNSGSGPGIGSAGAYFDDVVRQDGRWLFRRRKIDRFIAEGLL
jgi:ketosteroid isomerase-like protein